MKKILSILAIAIVFAHTAIAQISDPYGVEDAIHDADDTLRDRGIMCMGSDGTDARRIKTDTSGNIILGASSAVLGHVITDSGSVAACSQSGTWTVQPGNTANTTAWKVDGSAVTQPVSGTVTVTDGSGALNTIVDSGSLTCNAGTNLNTSLLALESGGNLAGAATSLAAIDDWDESDRAKVNPIVGVAGVAAGAGAVGTTTQRMTLASDDPAVTSVQIIDDWDESDRAKVNPIVGQAGIAAGNGVSGVTVPRVTIASDSTGVLACTQSGTWNVNNVSGTVSLPTGASTSANQSTQITSLQLIDDIVHSGDAAVSKYSLIGGVLDDTSPGSVTENQAQSLRMSSRRALYIEGPQAESAVLAANPVSMGAEARSTDKTAVASADIVTLISDTLGKLIVSPYHFPNNHIRGIASTTGTSDTSVIAAQGSGIRTYVTTAALSNSSATGTVVLIKTASTNLFQVYVAPGAAVVIPFHFPLRGGDNEALNCTAATGVTTLYCDYQGYTAAN